MSELASRYRAVLRAPHVKPSLAGSLVGRIPEGIVTIGLVILVKEATGSYALAGATAAVYGTAVAAAAPVIGRLVDRLGQREVLVPSVLVSSTALLAMGIWGGSLPSAALLALAGVAGAARPPLDSCLQALWPVLVERPCVQTAYTLEAVAQELIWIVGPLLLALLVATGSAGLPLVASGALAVAGTALFVSVPVTRARRTMPERLHWSGALAAPGVWVAILMGSLYGAGIGFLTVALPAFSSAHGSAAGAGVLIAIWGVGSILGGTFYGGRHWNVSLHRRAILLLGVLGLTLASLALAQSFVQLAILIFLAGLPLSPWLATLNALTQSVAPKASETEAFTWVHASETAGIALGNAAAGFIIQGTGPVVAFLCCGGLLCLGAFVAATKPCTGAVERRRKAEPGAAAA